MRPGRYYSIILGSFAAFDLLLSAALHHNLPLPEPNRFNPGQWLVHEETLNRHDWRAFSRRPDVLIALTFAFVTAGPTTTLPSDFNTASNTISAIGSGAGGTGGGSVFGGTGGGGGAFSSIQNYSGHSAGQVVNVQVGAGDTWFDSTSVLLAKAASTVTGGQAASGVGTTKFSGGNGGVGGGTTCSCACPPSSVPGSGGGGGGAGGPSGVGSNGQNGANSNLSGATGGNGGNADNNTVPGGTGGSGNGPAGSNGTEFDATHGSGAGGAGGGMVVCPPTSGNGGNGGRYGGGGGGGGGGSSGGGGNAFQGLIAIAYTPAAGGARSFGFIIS